MRDTLLKSMVLSLYLMTAENPYCCLQGMTRKYCDVEYLDYCVSVFEPVEDSTSILMTMVLEVFEHDFRLIVSILEIRC